MLQTLFKPDAWSAALIVLICVLITKIVFGFRRRKFPPGPSGLPLLGVLPLLTSRPDRKVAEWAKQYGGVMTLPFVDNNVVVLSTMGALNEGPVRNGEDYANRPWCYLHDMVWRRCGIAVTNYSDDWKEQRRFVLTSLRRFGFGKRSLIDKIIQESNYFAEAMLKLKGDFTKGRDLLVDVNANIISQLMLNRRFDYEDDKGFMNFFHGLSTRFNEASLALQLSIFVPWFHHIPPLRGTLRKLKSLFDRMHKTLEMEVKDHKQSFHPDVIRDVTDDYIRETQSKDEHNRGLFSDKMMKFILRDFFLAGTETLASTMTWSILILCNRRTTVLKRIIDEIDEVVGHEGRPNLEHRDSMHYTQAFMQEVYRYRTLLPFSVPTMASKDTKIGNNIIPKGTTVLQNLYAVHNDSDLWDEPDEFRVERHLDSDGKFVKSPNVIPFGVGLRHCVGKQLATIQNFILLVCILQKFDIVSDAAEQWQSEEVAKCGFVSMAPFDMKIRLVERL